MQRCFRFAARSRTDRDVFEYAIGVLSSGRRPLGVSGYSGDLPTDGLVYSIYAISISAGISSSPGGWRVVPLYQDSGKHLPSSPGLHQRVAHNPLSSII